MDRDFRVRIGIREHHRDVDLSTTHDRSPIGGNPCAGAAGHSLGLGLRVINDGDELAVRIVEDRAETPCCLQAGSDDGDFLHGANFSIRRPNPW